MLLGPARQSEPPALPRGAPRIRAIALFSFPLSRSPGAAMPLLAAADLATTLSPPWWATALLLTDWVIRLGTAVRVLMRRHDVELSLAWLLVVLVFPFGGAAVYWIFGEIRIGRRAAIRSLDPHADTERYLRRAAGPHRDRHGRGRVAPARRARPSLHAPGRAGRAGHRRARRSRATA